MLFRGCFFEDAAQPNFAEMEPMARTSANSDDGEDTMEKIAVASSDGINIDRHFGQADEFYVYEIDDEGGIVQKERRLLPSAETAAPGKLETAVELLSDVSYVLCAQIGPHAAETLAASSITGYALPGSVQKALQNYVKRRGLLKNLSKCSGPAVAGGKRCGGCFPGRCGL
jgi:nitrogen fixation protein NifB